MGFSFFVDDELMPQETESASIRIPEPQTDATGNKTEGGILLSEFLATTEPRRWKAVLLLSVTNSKKRKQPLEGKPRLGCLSASQIKRFLRLRSASAKLLLPKDVTMRETVNGTKYRQITQNPTHFGSFNNPSTYQINYAKETPRATMIRNPQSALGGTIVDILPRPHQDFESDAFGIARDYPHLITTGEQAQSSQHQTALRLTGTPALEKLKPRQKAKQAIRDSSDKDTETLERSDGGLPKQIIDKSYPSTQWPPSLNDPLLSLRRPLKNDPTQLETSMSTKNEPTIVETKGWQKPSSNGGAEQPPNEVDLTTNSTADTSEGQRILTSSQSSNASAPKTPLLDTSPISMTKPEDGDLNGMILPILSPAPTGPLPPLPKAHKSQPILPTVHSGSDQRTKPAPHVLDRFGALPLPKSPVRYRKDKQQISVSERKGSSTTLGIGFDADLHWPRPPSLTNHKIVKPGNSTETTSPTTSKTNDLFAWRKKRAQKTRALKKRDLEEVRSRQDLKHQGGISVLGDSDETDGSVVILPSMSDRYHSHEPSMEIFPWSSEFGNWDAPCSMKTRRESSQLDPMCPIDGTISGVQGVKKENSKTLAKERRKYTDHSTQYSEADIRCCIAARTSTTSLNSDALQRYEYEKIVSNQTSNNRPKPDPHAMEQKNASHPLRSEPPSWQLTHLETKLEGRLEAFERRTILLEAALLAVIKTSAALGGQAPSNGGRSSGISAASSFSAPLEAKLETLVAGMRSGGGPGDAVLLNRI